MDVTLGLWAVTIAGIIGLIVLDFVTVSHKPHEVRFKEALLWSIFYIGIAVAFGVGIWLWQGGDIGTQYFAAYLVEKSLSVDNLFVFIIILTQFAVPPELHQRVLLVGVVLALVLRAVFIAVGAAALATFAFTFVIFGAILIWTGIQLARHRNEDPEPKDNAVVRLARKRFAFSDDFDGTRMFTQVDGRRMATPMLLVIVAIGSTDLLFALNGAFLEGMARVPALRDDQDARKRPRAMCSGPSITDAPQGGEGALDRLGIEKENRGDRQAGYAGAASAPSGNRCQAATTLSSATLAWLRWVSSS